MESMLKTSLLAPIKTLKFCVSGEKQRSKRGSKWPGSKGRTGAPDPRLLRSYQADLERERKLREAMNAQKNAERAAIRAHFRRKYQLAKNAKDAEQLRAVGGRVCLPRDLAKMVGPEAPAKDDSFGLLRAFQSLSLSAGIFTGKQSQTPASRTDTEPCRVM
ncbi:complexin-3-like [Sinocyclocheilus grahami]|uniref:complexin-3-like n=1 Tax=Sinocyclocheilus grahami TaxID=75366 RepID=UPI0007ACDBB0|nr:PREDICTED: complexin-3-like [Sinocyclocheilus grahami]XP_016112550.1 PREDICTED: complexin-3-like [Sinocyclocheilus grahami]